jgi:hypothetical protein
MIHFPLTVPTAALFRTKTMTGKKYNQFVCKSAQQAWSILHKLGIDWRFSATLRHGNNYDVIVSLPRAVLGSCAHYINDNNELVATYSQPNNVLRVYHKPEKLGKLFLLAYNIFEKSKLRKDHRDDSDRTNR